MLRGYYRDFRLAEKLGEQFIRDLFHCILLDVEQEKGCGDLGKVDLLIHDVEELRTFPGSKKLAKIYQELSDELSSWLSKNGEFNEDNQFIGFKA